MKTFCFAQVGSPRSSSYQEFFRSLKVGEFAQVINHHDNVSIIMKDRKDHCQIALIFSYQEVARQFSFAWNCLPISYRNDGCLLFFSFEGEKTLYAIYYFDSFTNMAQDIYAFQMVPCPEHWKRKSHRKWTRIG